MSKHCCLHFPDAREDATPIGHIGRAIPVGEDVGGEISGEEFGIRRSFYL